MMTLSREQLEEICAQAKTAVPNKLLTDYILKTDVLVVQDIVQGRLHSLIKDLNTILPYTHFPKVFCLTALPMDFTAIIDGLNSPIKEVGLKTLAIIRILENSFPDLFEILLPNLIPASALALNATKLVAGIDCHMTMPSEAPVYEKEAFESFKVAVAKGNYKEICEFIRMVDHGTGFPQHPLVKYLFRIWAELNLADFVANLDKKSMEDFVLVYMVLREMSVPTRLKIGLKSNNCLVRLTLLDLCFKTKVPTEIPIIEDGASQIIMKLAANPSDWSQFCKYFGESPSRYPGLWLKVGVAINGQKKRTVSKLVESFSDGRHIPSMTEFGRILEGLMSCPYCDTTLADFFNSTDQVWRRYYRNRRKNLSDSSHKLEFSNYYIGVLNSILRRSNISQVKTNVRKLFKYLEASQNKWFLSRTQYLTHMLLFVGVVFPYLEAYQHKKDITSFDIDFEREIVALLELNYGFRCYGIWTENESFIANVRDIIQAIPPIRSAAVLDMKLLS